MAPIPFLLFLFPLLKPGPLLVVDLDLVELYLTASWKFFGQV